MKTRLTGLCRFMAMAAALCIAASASAQNVDFRLEPKGKMLGHSNEPRLVGCVDNDVLLLDRSGKKTILGRYNMAQNELATTVLATTKETECYGGYVNGNNADLLMVTDNDEGMRIWRERLNASTLQTAAEPATIIDMRGEKKDKFYFSVASSPDQELLAGVSVADRKGLDPEMKVSLFNRQLETYWHMPVGTVPFNQLLVNDSGEVVLGYCTIDSKRACTFTVVDGEREEHFSFKVSGEEWPLEATMVSYNHGTLVMAVTVCVNHKVVMPIGSNVNRVDFYSYDVRRSKLTVYSHDITDAESARMANAKEGKGTRNNWVQFGTITQTIADSEGAYLMMDQTWRVTRNDIPVEQHRMGMMVIRVDALGRVQWTRTLRMVSQSSWGGRDMVDYRWRATANGIMLAATQNAKNVALPDDKPVKNTKVLKTKAVISVFTLDARGDLQRSDFEVGKAALLGSARMVDSRHFLLMMLNGGGNGQFAHIDINK